MHLDEERLQRLVHGELELGAERRAREHVAGCEACRSEVARTEREQAKLSRLLRELDQPAPRLEPSDVAALAHAAGHGWGRRAAVVLVGLGIAGVAYAAPGSPIPGWVRAIGGRADPGIETGPAIRPDSLRSAEPVASGIAVQPGARLVIEFPAPRAGASTRVWLSDTSDVVVRALGGHASFSTSANRLAVESADSAVSFQILIPRMAPSVEIRAGTATVFRKHGARVTSGQAAESDGSYAIALTR